MPTFAEFVLTLLVFFHLWFCLRTITQANHERDAYRRTLFLQAKLPTAPFEPEREVADEPPVGEPTYEDFEAAWTDLDHQAFETYKRGLAETEFIRDPEEALVLYRARYGRQAPHVALAL